MNIREIIKEVNYIYYFSGGVAFFRTKDGKGEHQGLIDQSGEIVWDVKWRNLAMRSADHPDFIRIHDREKKEWLFLDIRTLQFEPQPEWYTAERQTPAWQMVNNAPTVQFIKGVETMFDYSPLRYLNEKYVAFADKNRSRSSAGEDRSSLTAFLDRKWGVLDLEGKEVLPAIFEDVDMGGKENHFVVKYDGLCGVMDDKQKWIIPREYSSLYCYEPHNAYVAYDQKPRRKRIGGMLDTEGKVILPFLYEHVFPSPTEDMITVKRRGRWMVINSKNEKLFDIGK